MMTSQALASMYAQIVNGVPKEQSKYVTDDESTALWESITREVEQAREADPNVVFSIPNEMPDSDEDEDEDDEDEDEAPADESETPPEGDVPPGPEEPEEPDGPAADGEEPQA
jgi:hypothetical protein